MSLPDFENRKSAMTPIGYPELSLGLNNQKLALLGVFARARDLGLPLALPKLCNFDPVTSNHELVSLGDFYSLVHLERFARAYDIELCSDIVANTENGYGCFVAGCERSGRDLKMGEAALDDFTCHFFKSLVPLICESATFRHLWQSVFHQSKVQIVLQLRIENDWIKASENLRTKPDPFYDDYALNYMEILEKFHSSFPNMSGSSVYIVCDEANLPVDKEKIRSDASERFNLKLLWKSDFLWSEELNSLSVLEKSLIDFEMAVTAPQFVGFSRSTFANLATMEAFCRSGKQPEHYIYNYPGPKLVDRNDFGTEVNPNLIVDRLYLRRPLIVSGFDDCLWSASLTAHLSKIGDVTSSTGPIPGTRRGYLVAGVADTSERFIEGFSIDLDKSLPGSLEYCTKNEDGVWTEWLQAGNYAGTRGMNKHLFGFSVRLTGRLALRYGCVCVGGFAGEVVSVGDGEECAIAQHTPLVCMQVVFRVKDEGITSIRNVQTGPSLK